MRNKNVKTDKNSQKKVIISSFSNPYIVNYTEEAIISLKKVRNIGLKKFSLTGNITSLKQNSQISFESSLERDYIYLLEFDTTVDEYFEQPLKIFYEVEGKKRYYVPDFYVKYCTNKRDAIIEIKYTYSLKKDKKKLEDKFKAARVFCQSNDIDFKILTEEDIRNELLFNSKFLLSYRNPKSVINYEDVELLEELIKSSQTKTPSFIINTLDTDIEHRAQLLYTLWYMIANDLAQTEINSKLTMSSKIWINE